MNLKSAIQALEQQKLQLVIQLGDEAIDQHKAALKSIRAKQRDRRAELARLEAE